MRPARKWKREFSDDMRELSGMGGGYEAALRKMVLVGLDWFDAHPDADPKFHGYQGVTGICVGDNADARALSKAMCDAVREDGGATGAMHQFAVGHVFSVRKIGWANYVQEMRDAKKKEDAAKKKGAGR